MIRLACEVIHPFKQIPVTRSSEQQGDNKGKRTRIDTTEGTMKKIICHTCKKKRHMEKDCWFKKNHWECFNYRDSNHKRNECPKLK
jgi:hypothetical protein